MWKPKQFCTISNHANGHCERLDATPHRQSRAARENHVKSRPVKIKGFRNEQSDALDANFLGTEYLNPYAIEIGMVKRWRELPDKSELSVTPAFGLVLQRCASPPDIPAG